GYRRVRTRKMVPEARTPTRKPNGSGSQAPMTGSSGAPHDPRTRELEVFAESSWLGASTLDLGEVLERLADAARRRHRAHLVAGRSRGPAHAPRGDGDVGPSGGVPANAQRGRGSRRARLREPGAARGDRRHAGPAG